METDQLKRRWFQFSLRTLFAVAPIVAVQCAVCLPALKECQQQKQSDDLFRSMEILPKYQTVTIRYPNLKLQGGFDRSPRE